MPLPKELPLLSGGSSKGFLSRVEGLAILTG
jgi:hypothetical protein